MEKKIIIGISSYEGSNSSQLLRRIASLLSEKDKIMTLHSLKNNYSLNRIITTINSSTEKTIHIIRFVSTKEEICILKESFKKEHFRVIGIEVPWEDCFKNLKQKGLIGKNAKPKSWRKRNKVNEYRKKILACHKEIQTYGDYLYIIDEQAPFEISGKIADSILLMH